MISLPLGVADVYLTDGTHNWLGDRRREEKEGKSEGEERGLIGHTKGEGHTDGNIL